MIMLSLLHSSRIANKDPQDYEACSNIMWTTTWALNTLVRLEGIFVSYCWISDAVWQSLGTCGGIRLRSRLF